MPRFVGCEHATMNNLIYSPIGDWYNHDYL
jgi:hypothetical protein